VSQPDDSPKQMFMELSAERPFYGGDRPDLVTVERLRKIADNWGEVGAHFAAGYALSQGIMCAWGDPEVMASCLATAVQEFQKAISAPGAPALEQAASVWMCLVEFGTTRGILFDSAEQSAIYRSLQGDLARILSKLGNNTEDISARFGFLVRGVILTTDFEGNWSTTFPEVEIRGQARSGGADQLTLYIESAFRYFIDSGDYVAANGIASQCPEAFTTPGLRGWRAALVGLLSQDEAANRFAEAATELAADEPIEERRQAGISWDSSNRDLWSKYFSARSFVAEIVRSPTRADELLHQAQETLTGTESGWIHPQVTCFRILVKVLSQVLQGDGDGAASRAKTALVQSRRLFGSDEYDELIIDFLDHVRQAFYELRRDPASVVLSTGVGDALAALGRIPLVGPDVASAITPLVAQRTFAGFFDRDRSWMHRTIESIGDERTFQRLILRLMQGRLPLYAQIRQGPLEYGKDIAVLVEDNGIVVLQMYQVKVGNITVPVWRIARAELEEIFQVELPKVQLSVEPDRREGVLIFNGHLNPSVEGPVTGWLDEQRRDHGRSFFIMHLDLIVD